MTKSSLTNPHKLAPAGAKCRIKVCFTKGPVFPIYFACDPHADAEALAVVFTPDAVVLDHSNAVSLELRAAASRRAARAIERHRTIFQDP